ncbi:ATP-binding protein [Nocardiopsis sp. NPDC049922]|uniref:ATP-binding protein n=1 Tax=Nocardiopsis sp. NPDC049922 TaxID=3155157 RepID=UPI0033D0137D
MRTAYFGGTWDQVAQVRSWCRCGMRMPAHRAFPVLLVVSELVTNAVVHTASGSRCGRVRISMEILPGQVVLVGVTDDGPRTQRPITVPALTDPVEDADPNGRGLRLVAALAEKWWWTGCPGGPLTVWALVDPDRDLDA